MLAPSYGWQANSPARKVLERQEHNAMEGGPDILVNAIVKFAAIQK